ncbi:MAG: FKBP-type peptidyl-prolyl cis-trans isomerase [Candidatus Cyclobacteriaceae bacterium M2_1C_046]
MKNIKLGILLLAGLAACDTGTGTKTTPSGAEYEVLRNSENEVAQDGHFLVLNMQFVGKNDSVWVNTVETGIPRVVIKQDSVWKESGRPLEEMLIDAGVGDSMKITLAASKLFEGGQMPPNVGPEDNFTIYIGVQDVLSEEQFQVWQQEMAQKQQAKAEEQRTEQHEKDVQTIKEYLETNNIDAQATESGLSYVIKEEGTGQKAEAGDQVRVNYAGYVLGGEYFDTSLKELAEEKGLFNPQREYGPLTFTLGQQQVIQGWDEGISLLSEGGKATLYVPSTMAYGPRQRGEVIGANSILVFDVELVEVIEENE